MFRRLDYPLWRQTAHNPVRMLQLICRRTCSSARRPTRRGSRSTTARSRGSTRRARRGKPGASSECPELEGKSIAYFSAEFALHQSLPIYAGGLGVLAGDHCKEASDLGVPLIGVGFMYPQGYFHQSSTSDGWQEEIYEKLNWTDAPIEPAMTPDGKPCITAVPLGNRTVLVAVWRVRVGRVTLYLLDTDLEENAPWDRELSARLYGGDRETRVQQEIILGIGGVRVLQGDGLRRRRSITSTKDTPRSSCCSASAISCEQGSSFEDALEEVRRTTVFTTHTPVPAGHDAFPFHLVETHLAGAWGDLGALSRAIPRARRTTTTAAARMFNMTALALRTCGAVNGVSQLHGEVTQADVAVDLAGHAGRAAAGQVDHQRRARADLDFRGDRRAASNGTSGPTGSTSRRPGVLRSRARHSRRGAVGGAAVAARVPVQLHPRAGAAALDAGARRRGARRRRRHDVRSTTRSRSASRAASPATSGRS